VGGVSDAAQVSAARAEEDARLALGGGVDAPTVRPHALATQRESDVFERTVTTAVLLTHLATALLDRGDSKGAVEALRSAIRIQVMKKDRQSSTREKKGGQKLCDPAKRAFFFFFFFF